MAGLRAAASRLGAADVWLAIGMTAFVVAVYVTVVLGGGALFGRTASPHVGLSVLATALVALGFEPVRNRLQLVLAPSPYDVLRRFADGVHAADSADEDPLTRMSRLLAQGTGGLQAQVWLRTADGESLAASWPPGSSPLPATGDALHSHDIRDRAEVLGRVTVLERAGHPLTPLEERLLADLARHAGLVLRNVRLAAELRARVAEASARAEELRASRERIVAAHDDARRRIERDIHDGAQQHLVALAVNLRLAGTLAQRDEARAAAMLPDLRSAVEQTAVTLTELSSGLYPRVLADHGLAEALTAASRVSPVPVHVHAGRLGRYSPELEAVVYFCCLEAVQNAAKHADARHVNVVLDADEEALAFYVTDDGRGFDSSTDSSRSAPRSGLANMRDRVAAVGGTFVVRTQPGGGTRIEGRIPLDRDAGEVAQ